MAVPPADPLDAAFLFWYDLSIVKRLLAKACSLSATHFRRLFRRAMGTTFQRFEPQQRAAAAERLLCTTDFTLEAVAARCGFADASHLSRVFRGLHGHSAGAHREAFASLPAE